MTSTVPTRSPRSRGAHSRRWLFITLIVLSVVYLGLTIRVFLLEADMSLGLSRISGPGLAGLIVNRQEYTPPVDSIIRMSQATMFLNVVEVLDSLDGDGNRKDLRRTAFAEILNRYTTSLTEYRWVRSVCVSAMRRQPSSRMGRADSVNMQRLRMFVPRFREYPSFFRDTLDREAL